MQSFRHRNMSMGNHSTMTACNESAVELVEPTSFDVFIGVMMIVIIITSLAGNLLIMYAFATNAKLRVVTNYFIINLTLSDVLTACLVIPFDADVKLNGLSSWTYGDVMCKVWTTAYTISVPTSILTLCVVSIDRYQAISNPLGYRAGVTLGKTKAVFLISAVWGLSLFMAFLPALVGPPLGGTPSRDHECAGAYLCLFDMSPIYSAVVTITEFFLPSIVMAALYFRMYVIVTCERSIFDSAQRAPKDAKRENARRKRREISPRGRELIFEQHRRRCDGHGEPADFRDGRKRGGKFEDENIRRVAAARGEAGPWRETASERGDVERPSKMGKPNGRMSKVNDEEEMQDGGRRETVFRNCRFDVGPRQLPTENSERRARTTDGGDPDRREIEDARQKAECAENDVDTCADGGTATTFKDAVSMPTSERGLSRTACEANETVHKKRENFDERSTKTLQKNTSQYDNVSLDNKETKAAEDPKPKKITHPDDARKKRRISTPKRDNERLVNCTECFRTSKSSRDKSTVANAGRRGNGERSSQTSQSLHQAKLARHFLAIVLVQLACWYPFCLLSIVLNLCNNCVRVSSSTHDILLAIGYLSCAINPFMYAYQQRSFRVAFKQMLNMRR